jgi:hypothetical protein
MESEGSIWGLLLFLVVVAAFAAWRSGAFAKLRDNIRDAANRK